MRSLFIALLALSTPVSVSAESHRPFFIDLYAKKYQIDPELLIAICTVESRCRTNVINHNDGTIHQKKHRIVSKSYGMFQLKLATARSLGFKLNYKNLLKTDTNTLYAAKLLKSLYDKYHNTIKVLSAYNAGKYTTHNRNYVDKVLRQFVTLKLDRGRK